MGARGQSPRALKLGFLGLMAISASFIIFMYGTTFQIPDLNAVLVPVVLMGVIGFSLAFILNGIQVTPFQIGSFVSTVMWTIVSALSIWLVNKTVPLKLVTYPLDPRLLAVLAGVMEEVFFRLWLLPMIFKFTHSTFISIGSVTLIWTVYHLARYGGSQGALLIVFLSGIMLAVAVMASRSADPAIFAHAVVNYFAVA